MNTNGQNVFGGQTMKTMQLHNDYERKLAERKQIDMETNQPISIIIRHRRIIQAINDFNMGSMLNMNDMSNMSGMSNIDLSYMSMPNQNIPNPMQNQIPNLIPAQSNQMLNLMPNLMLNQMSNTNTLLQIRILTI